MKDLELQAQKIAKILKLVAHPMRLIILCKLLQWPKTVSEIEQACGITQSQISQFLGKMKSEWLLSSQKDWLYVTYSIDNDEIKQLLGSLSTIYCK